MNLRVLGVVLVVVLSLGVPSGLFADSLVGAGSGSVNLGNIFNIPVSISNVSDNYAFQNHLSYDPAVLELLGNTEGAILPTAGATSFSPGAIDNLAGTPPSQRIQSWGRSLALRVLVTWRGSNSKLSALYPAT